MKLDREGLVQRYATVDDERVMLIEITDQAFDKMTGLLAAISASHNTQ